MTINNTGIVTSNPINNQVPDLYGVLVSVMPTGEFTVSDIAKQACAAINELGPFERSDFDTSDICHMLAHLVESGCITQRVVERKSSTDRLEGRNFFYTRTMSSRAL